VKVEQTQKHILEYNLEFGKELSKIRKTVVLAIFMVRYRRTALEYILKI